MDNLNNYPATLCVSKATLALSGAVATFTTTGATLYSIKGKMYSTAAAAGAVTGTTDANTGTTFVPIPAGVAASGANPGKAYGSVFVFCYKGDATAAAAIKIVQGPIVDVDPVTGVPMVAPQFPIIPDGYCPFGYAVIKGATNSAAFAFGTSLWNATGITVTAVDIMNLPDRPQVS
jgi:hypothetical protein